MRLHLLKTLLVVLLLASPLPAQSRLPVPDEVAQQLIRTALLLYFDQSSVFEVTVTGAAVVGEVLVIDDVIITGRPAVMRGLRTEIFASFSGFEVNAREAASSGFKTAKINKATIVGRVAAKDVAEYLVATAPHIAGPSVKFRGGEFELAGTIGQASRSYPASVRGTLAVEQKQRIRVIVTQAQVSGSDVPTGLVSQELAKINPVLDVTGWPVPVRIQRVVLHDDRLEILATTDP